MRKTNNAINAHQCAAAISQRRTQLSFAFYVSWDAALLRACLRCLCCSGWGQQSHRCSRKLRGWSAMSHHKHWVFIMAGVLISGNFVYVYAVAPSFRQKAGPVTPMIRDLPDCQPFQPDCALVLGGVVFDRLLYRLSARADSRPFRFVKRPNHSGGRRITIFVADALAVPLMRDYSRDPLYGIVVEDLAENWFGQVQSVDFVALVVYRGVG